MCYADNVKKGKDRNFTFFLCKFLAKSRERLVAVRVRQEGLEESHLKKFNLYTNKKSSIWHTTCPRLVPMGRRVKKTCQCASF